MEAVKKTADEKTRIFYEKEEEERIQKERSKMDEDGFVMVTRKGPRIAPKEKKAKELVNFYRFQIREQKRDGISID